MPVHLYRPIFALAVFHNSGCQIGEVGPHSPDSPADRALIQMQNVAEKSKAVNASAHELESLVDEARRRIAKGENKDTVIEEMTSQLRQIQQTQKELQKTLMALEDQLTIQPNKKSDPK